MGVRFQVMGALLSGCCGGRRWARGVDTSRRELGGGEGRPVNIFGATSESFRFEGHGL